MTVINIYNSQESGNLDLIRRHMPMDLECKGISSFSTYSNPLTLQTWSISLNQNKQRIR